MRIWLLGRGRTTSRATYPATERKMQDRNRPKGRPLNQGSARKRERTPGLVWGPPCAALDPKEVSDVLRHPRPFKEPSEHLP